MIGFFWGAFEATFFFFVPDIWLSYVVIENPKEAFVNIIFATLGALLGGAIMYSLSSVYSQQILHFLEYIPAVSPPMIEHSGDQVARLGIWQALMYGITTGIPYKLYATWSGILGQSFSTFLLASAIIRSVRFTITTTLMLITCKLLQSTIGRGLYLLHATIWLSVYCLYFYHFI